MLPSRNCELDAIELNGKYADEAICLLIKEIKSARTIPSEYQVKVFDPSAVIPLTSHRAMAQTTERIVAIGTSTGGTQALEAVLIVLPRVSPGMVIVQHMPESFTAAFAHRLNNLCEIEVREAVNGDRVVQGRALIAPGGNICC